MHIMYTLRLLQCHYKMPEGRHVQLHGMVFDFEGI